MKKLVLAAASIVSMQIFAQNTQEIQEVTLNSKTPESQVFRTETILTQKDLKNFSGKDLGDVLQTLPGIQISGEDNNGSEPKTLRIRGGNMSNVLILIDGIPYKDVSGTTFSAADLRLISLENIDSVEILNGVSSVLFGSNAATAVINIRTKKNFNQKLTGEIGVKSGSFGTYGQHANLAGKTKNITYKFSGNNEKSDGMSAAEGIDFEKDGFEKQNILAGIGYQTNSFNTEITSGFNHNLYHYDGGSFTDAFYRNNDQSNFINWSTALKHKLGQANLKIGATENSRLTQELVLNNYQDQYKYKGRNINADLYNSIKINTFITVLAGVAFEKQQMSSSTKPYNGNVLVKDFDFADASAETFAAYGNVQLHKDIFNLDAGLRWTNHSKFGNNTVYSINPYLYKTFTNFYGKLGYSFATAFNAPTLYENFGSLPYTVANFDLKPETSENHEISAEFGKSNGTFKLTAAAFLRNEKDEFFYQTISYNPFYGGYINAGSDRIRGFETSVFIRVNKITELGGNFSYVEKTNEAAMLRQPKQRINSFVRFKPTDSFNFTINHQFVGSKRDSYFDMATYEQKEILLPEYHIFGISATQKIFSGLNAALVVNNILGKKYIDIYGYTTKPRNYMLSVNYSF